MPDYRSLYDSAYLGSWDLPKGRDVTVTIAKVEGVKLHSMQGERKKPVVHFEGKDKGMVCNKTNGRAIAGMYGVDTSHWIGKRIAVYVTQTEVGGKTVDCLRVRPKVPTDRKPRAAAATEPVTAPEATPEDTPERTYDTHPDTGERIPDPQWQS